MANRWRRRPEQPRDGRGPGWALGCLIWLVLLLIFLVVLSVLFGGFRLGTRAGGPAPRPPAISAVAVVGWPASQGASRP